MWLLIMGITPFIGSLPDLLDIENAVQNAWNAPLTERAMDIASAYEIIWTTHAMLFGAICIAVSFFLSSASRAKFAAIASAAVIVFIAPGFAYSNYGDSNQLSGGFLALFVLMHTMVLLTGLVHWNDGEESK
jgi:hypothetical protein